MVPFREEGVGEVLHLRELGMVYHVAVARDAFEFELGDHVVHAFDDDVRHHHRAAPFRQSQGQGASDAGAAAGDDGRLALEEIRFTSAVAHGAHLLT